MTHFPQKTHKTNNNNKIHSMKFCRNYYSWHALSLFYMLHDLKYMELSDLEVPNENR